MSKIDWSKAPEGAEFSSTGLFYKRDANGNLVYYENSWWHESTYSLRDRKEREDYEENPETQSAQEWPTETRIDNIGRNRTEDDMGHYDEQREQQGSENTPSRYAISGAREQQLMSDLMAKHKGIAEKPAQPEQEEPAPLRKYDRIIKGKRNTGTCTVDVYRVLSAFEITEPELQHCIKKLLAAGQRGAKDYRQDLREAAVSLGMLIDRLTE